MKTLSLLFLLALPFSASAGIFEKHTQDCVLSVLTRFPRLSELPPEIAGVFAKDDLNWELMIITKFSDGRTGVAGLLVQNGEFSKALLEVEGFRAKRVNIERCF